MRRFLKNCAVCIMVILVFNILLTGFRNFKKQEVNKRNIMNRQVLAEGIQKSRNRNVAKEIDSVRKTKQLEISDNENLIISKITQNLGHKLAINIYSEKHRNSTSMSFNSEDLYIPQKIENRQNSRQTRSFDKYVFVYSEYTEQMSMSTLSVLSLCGQAQFGRRKVVRPFIHNSRFVSDQKFSSLGILYDLKHLDKLLELAEYSPMVDVQEYKTACEPTDRNHASIHFLYTSHTSKYWNKAHLKITDEYYEYIVKKAKVKGWTECPFLDRIMGITPSTKQYCVHPDMITDWKVLEREIVEQVKCLNIMLWRGIGVKNYRSHFTENGLKFSHTTLQYSLKPSQPILGEAARFRETYLPDKYIALYVRAEFILVPHHNSLFYLKRCIDIMVMAVNAYKRISGISHVYVASDMSKYGSGFLLKFLFSNKLPHDLFLDIYNSLISRIGGLAYHYNASTSEIRDRGAIALVDQTLLVNAEYLITAGDENMSSFVRLVVGKFLANYREKKDRLSRISICGK